MSSSPLVTVVIPAFNAESFIGEAIASIQNQTLDDWQLIVVNDGSSDQTLSAARHAARDDPRIRLIHFDRNQGISVASNAGFDAARGEFIARLDADDIALPARLAVQVAAFRDNARLAAAGSHARVFGDVPEGIAYCSLADGDIKAHLLDGLNTISGGTIMVRGSFVRRHRIRFDEAAVSAEDLDYLTSIMAGGGELANVDDVLTEHRSHCASFTNSREGVAREYLQIARRRLLSLWYPGLDSQDIDRVVALFSNLYAPYTDAFIGTVRAVERLVAAEACDYGQASPIVHGIVLDRLAQAAGVYRDNKLIDASHVQAMRGFVSPAVAAVLERTGV
ncbi:glycosyl transferase family 2 [Caballeronia cordobensis]|uniref:Glycosyl transferase family 2 n=1 Tax=Caballeronia cordobensis TaxID=1353886 RepID=A0A158J4N7_CABCO|nr:glycosyltransferase family 2 protein [Caballeronia cordobensis]SAL63922.1 glycosyl transferase family 2 [Caballeronia cordobensis]